MVIQRLQSLLLLISSIALIFFSVFPALTNGNAIWGANTSVPTLILTILTILLTLISIFMFKNFRRQKLVIKLSVFFSLVLQGIVTTIYFEPQFGADAINNVTFLPLVAFILQLFALKKVKDDEKLLRSADRIR